MMDKERLKAEQEVLKRKLPEDSYRFVGLDKFQPHLLLLVKTSAGNIYTLRIELDEFPDEDPIIFIKNGDYLDVDESIPTYRPTLEDWSSGFCHIRHTVWNPVLLYKIFDMYSENTNHSPTPKVFKVFEDGPMFSQIWWNPLTSLFNIYILCNRWIDSFEEKLKV